MLGTFACSKYYTFGLLSVQNLVKRFYKLKPLNLVVGAFFSGGISGMLYYILQIFCT